MHGWGRAAMARRAGTRAHKGVHCRAGGWIPYGQFAIMRRKHSCNTHVLTYTLLPKWALPTERRASSGAALGRFIRHRARRPACGPARRPASRRTAPPRGPPARTSPPPSVWCPRLHPGLQPVKPLVHPGLQFGVPRLHPGLKLVQVSGAHERAGELVKPIQAGGHGGHGGNRCRAAGGGQPQEPRLRGERAEDGARARVRGGALGCICCGRATKRARGAPGAAACLGLPWCYNKKKSQTSCLQYQWGTGCEGAELTGV